MLIIKKTGHGIPLEISQIHSITVSEVLGDGTTHEKAITNPSDITQIALTLFTNPKPIMEPGCYYGPYTLHIATADDDLEVKLSGCCMNSFKVNSTKYTNLHYDASSVAALQSLCREYFSKSA
ncbi:hypothetical protein LJB83_00440 [Clostridia bacterium OttesenSCG-928-F22]|nr:hypothetical protein [Clostridia bacterium OttesenSCG-928-F22]